MTPGISHTSTAATTAAPSPTAINDFTLKLISNLLRQFAQSGGFLHRCPTRHAIVAAFDIRT